MLKLHIIQARYGDCLVLEYGAPQAPRYLLIDGGPKYVYGRHLQPVLETIGAAGGSLDLVILSHVDEDHVYGLLDLFNDLLWQRIRGLEEMIALDKLWHNSFKKTLGEDLGPRLVRVLDRSGPARSALSHTDKTSRDIAQGDELTRRAESLGLDINPGFGAEGVVTVDTSPGAIELGNLSLRIVGPTEANIAELRADWLAWLQDQEDQVLVPDPAAAERAARSLDDSVPNLSSIMVLVEAEGKRLLFTGDGRGDHLAQGLGQAGLLDADGKLHVDLLKLPHHGSKRNITPDFAQNITADRYVISASGRHGHPHKDTLRWVVGAARDQGRDIEIVATNSTSSLRALPEERPPQEYRYHLAVMAEGQNEKVLDLSA